MFKKVALIILVTSLLAPAFLQAKTIVKVGIVLSVGGLRDKSFNDATYDGIEQLRNSGKCLVEVIEPSNISDIETALEYFCNKDKDLICAVGIFANDAVRKVSLKHSDKKFVLLDSVVKSKNVLSILFDEEEGSFYAGAFAGLTTKTNIIGFLGGMYSPVVSSFERGFKNGVKFVNANAKVISRYIGDTPKAFYMPDKAFELGLKMNKLGADIVYHASGKSGMGLIDAARRGNFLVIGVDSDQSTAAPGRVPASMVKRLDNALIRAVAYYQSGKFKGGVWTLGLKDSGVELVLSRFNKSLITPDIRKKLTEIYNFLINKKAK